MLNITYIALLRGINVGGNNKIAMKLLQLMFCDLGFFNVSTYIQSGNVIFNANEVNVKQLAIQIEQKILERFGFKVPVLICTKSQLISIFNENWFINEKNIDINQLYVTLLEDIPAKKLVDNLQIKKINTFDQWIINNTTIYLYCVNGYGNTKLNNQFFETHLQATATTRSWKTICELIKLLKV